MSRIRLSYSASVLTSMSVFVLEKSVDLVVVGLVDLPLFGQFLERLSLVPDGLAEPLKVVEIAHLLPGVDSIVLNI